MLIRIFRQWQKGIPGKTLASTLLVAFLLVWCLNGTALARQPGQDLDPGPSRPAGLPASLSPNRPDPDVGLRFGLGFPVLKVKSDSLNKPVEGGSINDTGVMLNLDLLLGAFRVGYARHLYRKTLDEGTLFEDRPTDTLNFDSDQLWVFHGFRIWSPLFLGYGLGWQRRTVEFTQDGNRLSQKSESGFLAGVSAEWTFALPFSFNFRWFADLGDGLIKQQGATLQFNYQGNF